MIETLPLRRVARVANGGTPTSDEANWGGEIPWATPVDLGLHHGGAVEETARTLTEQGARTGSSTVPAGSVLVSTRAPIGYVARTNVTMAFNQGCRGLIPGDRIDARFLAFALLAAHQELDARGQGSTFSELSADGLASVPVPVPPIDEQRRIVDFLDTETARLDTLARTRGLQRGLLNNRWHSSLAKHFHAAQRRPLKRVASWREGPGIMAVDFRDEGRPLLRIRNLVDDSINLDGCGFVSESDARTRWSHFAVQPGELLISGSASTGACAVVPDTARGAIPYTGLIRMWPSNPNIAVGYLRYFLLSPVFLEQVNLLKTGVAIQHWGPSHLAQVQIPLPPLKDQRLAESELSEEESGLRAISDAIDRQLRLVAERRQALVTAAVTGQLDVTTAREGRS